MNYNNLTKQEICDVTIRMMEKGSEIVTLLDQLDREYPMLNLTNAKQAIIIEIMRCVNKNLSDVKFMEGGEQ